MKAADGPADLPVDRHYSGRAIPNFCILDCREVRFMPSFAAAPEGPAITQLHSFSDLFF